ncbi:MAG: phenylalanine--tRNA ligase subunit beta [Oscillospiraceae bacterium]|jgi:phenylalanyl-tRNA synthetase beta chain|nr:phenylalanine--tRNA ligase subunit beta [Oscillospiraceae bacterium]
MILSMKWLKEFVDIDISAKEFAEAMTMSGLKIGKYELEGQNIENVIVGRVSFIEKHPNAERLFVCLIDTGKEEKIQIITGAKNLLIEDLVPVALHGSTLADGTKIKKGKIRGLESNGMLCSLGELGLTLNDFPYAVEDGIFVLQEECALGQDIRDAIGLNDVKLEFELTSNRPDCFSVIGVAREAAATLKKEFKTHEPVLHIKNEENFKQIDVCVEDKELCPVYCAAVVKDVNIGPSPRFIREKLRAMGVRSINNIVDITNYVMLEYGQPLHAFDLNFLKENEITVRRAVPGEQIITLDKIKRNLSKHDLIIADKLQPIAIAGVMGGKFSGVQEDTKCIVLESANFKADSVRSTSRAHALRTESSYRFEKGLDSQNCVLALKRAIELIEHLNAGKLAYPLIIKDYTEKAEVKIKFCPDWINNFLGTKISEEKMREILERLDCKFEKDRIVVPSYRNDLREMADIAEEIARFYGYNNISSTFHSGCSGGFYTKRQKFNRKISDCLIALGLNEIITFSFFSPKSYDKILLPENDGLRNSVKILNPLGEDSCIMRTTALPSMLEVLSKNYNNQNSEANLFEIAKEYTPCDVNYLPNEKNTLVAGFYGKYMDFFAAKGILEEFLKYFGLECEVKAEASPSFHPGRCANVQVKLKKIGVIGEIHPEVCENYGIDDRVYVFSIDLDALWEDAVFDKFYRELPKFPAVKRDLALVCDLDMPFDELRKVIKRKAGDLLEEVELFDLYVGDQVLDGKKSLAFRLTLRSSNSTLKEDEINRVVEKIIKELKKIDVVLRE